MLEEANARLKKTKINEDQLRAINSLYILLDLHKDDFCKIIDTVGLDKLIKKQRHYDRLIQAENELAAKEKYLQAKTRLEELENEKLSLEQVVNNYKPI
jgi:outer membrane PBP1 activator LpoA protein